MACELRPSDLSEAVGTSQDQLQVGSSSMQSLIISDPHVRDTVKVHQHATQA